MSMMQTMRRTMIIMVKMMKITMMTVTMMVLAMMTITEMAMAVKDANYKCRAQGGNASCILTLALPLMQKELGCSLSEDADDHDDHFKDGDQD